MTLLAAEPATDDGGLETIMVTARKHSENLETTPISITAFTAEKLNAQGITQVNRIQDFTPNLTFQNVPSNSGLASNAAIYIRGIGQNDFAPTVDPGVGMYVDGVYLGRSVGGVFDLIDVNSVEVLRGPQGTLFGRNTIGGAINITTIQPDGNFKAKGDIKYGTDNRINVRAMVSGPLSDVLFAKIDGGSFLQDGYVNAPNLGTKFGNQDTKTIRGALRFVPSGTTFEATLAADYMSDKSNGVPVVITGIDQANAGSFVTLANHIATGNPALCYNAANATNTACYNNRIVSNDTNYSTDSTYSHLEIWSTSLTMGVDLMPGVHAKSITAYRETTGAFAQDRDGSNLGINHVSDVYTQTQFSEELQLTGNVLDNHLNWVTGLYYFTETGEDVNPVDFLVGGAHSGGFFDYKDWAAFAQATYKITDKLSATAGVRYTQDRKQFLPDQYVTSNLPPYFTVPVGTLVVPHETVDADVNKATPMANVSYQFTPELMAYASFSQGFKGGGYTQRIFPPEPSLPSFKPETANSYESGLKFQGFDNRLRVNGAIYYTDYKDMQLLVADATRVGPYITNAGKARIRGFELESNIVPLDGLHLDASVGLTDARFTQLDASVQGLTLDSKFVFISKWTVSGSVEQDFHLPNNSMVIPRLDWSYRSGFFTNANGIDTPVLYQPGYSVFNASTRWQSPTKVYTLTAGVDNLTDNKYRTFGDYQSAFGFYMQSFDRGRQYYVKVGFSF